MISRKLNHRIIFLGEFWLWIQICAATAKELEQLFYCDIMMFSFENQGQRDYTN